ncbi:MAG: DsbA family protein [Candidatus Nanosalina sp.]
MVECDFCGEEFEDEQELHAHWSEHEDELNSHQKDQMKKAKRKKEEKNKQRKKKRKKQVIYGFAGVLALGVAAMIVPQLIPQGGSPAPNRYNLSIEGQPVLGNESASVTVIEFGDYRCPYCRQFEMTTFPKIKENYIETGKIKFSFINLALLGQGSQQAAIAAECVYRQNESQFWDYHKGIYENQGPESENWVTQDLLMQIARDTTEGLDYNQLESCIANKKTFKQVREERAIANKNGVSSTPTIFVNGQKIVGNSYSRVKQAIESELR